jgi:hypothetical protein
MKKENNKQIQLVFWEKDKTYSQNQYFVVPNMAAFVRDVTEHGNIGAIVKRALKLSLSSLIKMAWWNKFNLLKLAKKDFATGVSILVQMEILQILKYNPAMIALTDQVSDLAVALQNTRILSQFLTTTKQVGVEPAIVTNNLISMIQTLSTLNARNVKVVTPFNSYGYEMNPSQAEVEAMLKMIDPSLIYAISPVLSKEEDVYLQRFGINQKVVKWF